ncbi:MAG: hypothetical protein QXP27_10005 [Candidatus Methanomethyliaceae archaeon]
MAESAFELRTVTLKLRPYRYCVLLHKNASLESVEDLFAEMSKVWGGRLTLLVPTDGREIHPLFMTLLSRFDPDIINAHCELSEELKELLNETLSPLTALGQEEGVRQYLGLGHIKTVMSLATLLRSIGVKKVINVVVPKKFPVVYRLLVYSRTGHLDENTVSGLQKDGNGFWLSPTEPIEVEEREFVPGDLFHLDALREETPFGVCDRTLGYRILSGPSGDQFIPRAVWDSPAVTIVGSSLEDFCLYYALALLRGDVHWVPQVPDRLAEENKASDADMPIYEWLLKDLASRLRRIVDSPGIRREVYLFSLSEPLSALEAVRQLIANNAAHGSVVVSLGGGDVVVDWKKQLELERERVREAMMLQVTPLSCGELCRLLPYSGEPIQRNSIQVYTQQFYRGTSVSEVPTPKPKSFDLSRHPAEYQWITEVEIQGYRLPRRPVLLDGHLQSLSGKALSRGEARISRRGFAYESIAPFVGAGWDIDMVLVRPQLRLLPEPELFRRLFEHAGYAFELSDKGKYLFVAAERAGSLAALCDLLTNKDLVAIFRKYLDKRRNEKAVLDEGVYLKGRRYLDLVALCKVLGLQWPSLDDEDKSRLIGLLDTLIGKSLVSRGFLLKCQTCLNLDFYRFEDLQSEEFQCTRCRTRQKFFGRHLKARPGPEPAIFYALDELMYQFLEHHGQVTALMLRYLDQAKQDSFLYLPEISVWRAEEREGQPYCEVDCVAFLDGRIVLGEAKLETSQKQLKKQMAKYGALARDLRVDTLVLADLQQQRSPEEQDRIRGWLDRVAQGWSFQIQFLGPVELGAEGAGWLDESAQPQQRGNNA